MTSKILGWIAFALLTLLYAYMVIAAAGNLLLLPDMASTMDLSMTANGWFWLVLGVALPLIAYVAALLVGRKRSGAARLLVLATALALTAAVQLEIMHLVPQASFFAA